MAKLFSIARRGRRKKDRKEKKTNVRTINDYVIGPLLGIGGYAVVNVGKNRKTGELVALKCLLEDKQGIISASKRKQFLRGVDLLTKVGSDENVIKLLSFDKDTVYTETNGKKSKALMMALEHAPNGELFDYLMYTGHFDELTCRSYFHQLIDGLDAIHSAGYTHRDLKPENLLLSSTYTLKIADFGFASNQPRMQTACGTKGYLAPELLKGYRYTNSVDIFAAGIILFIMFCGFPPFNDANTKDWWFNRLERGWKERDTQVLLDKKGEWSRHGLFWAAHERSFKYPEDFKDFLLKVLHFDPIKRVKIPEMRKNDRLWYLNPRKLYGTKERDAKKREKFLAGLSWYQKPIKSSRQLGEILEKRRKICFRERAKKVAKQQHEHDVEAGLIDRDIKRTSVDDETGDGSGDKRPCASDNMIRNLYQRMAKEIDPDDDYWNCLEDLDADSLFIATPFYFFTYFEPVIVAAVFNQVCQKKSGTIQHYPKQSRFVITSKMEKIQSKMILKATFQVTIHGHGVGDDDEYVVSCKRLQGDPLAFKHIIEEFLSSKQVGSIMKIDKDIRHSVGHKDGFD